MPGALGIVVTWGGYLLFIWGYSKVKSANGLAPTLSLSDCALPSHRATYISAATTYALGENAGFGANEIAAQTTGNPQTAVVNPTTGINQYGGTAGAGSPEGPPAPVGKAYPGNF